MLQAVFSGRDPDGVIHRASRSRLGRHDLLTPGMMQELHTERGISGSRQRVVFLPQILILFMSSCYWKISANGAPRRLPMDRIMGRAGLARAALHPDAVELRLCDPGIMATRVIDNRATRLDHILVAPLMTCSARIPGRHI